MSTKITKVKTEPKTINEVHSGASSSSPSSNEVFCGFDNVSLNKDQIKKQDTLNKILDQLSASCSSDIDEPVKPASRVSEETEENEDREVNEENKEREEDEEREENKERVEREENKENEEKEPEEAMTVDTGHESEGDSEQMEIDMENEKNAGKEQQEQTKDSDVESVKSAGEKDSKKDVDEENSAVTDNDTIEPSALVKTTLKGNGTKVEYCGTCDTEVNDAEEGICCDGVCERWFHLRCSGLSQAEYDELGLDENAKWACNKCSGKPPPQLPADAKPLLTVRKDLVQITTPSPSIKRKSTAKEGRTPRIDISSPAFLKPFDFGWKRELVYRSTNDNQNRRQGDIYYYTPKGKKLRSLREISDQLVNTDLTIDNFTFWKEPLGIDDPDKEIIRDAKFKLVKDGTSSPAVPKKSLTPKAPKTPKITPKLTATVTPLESSGTVKASASVTPRVVFKGKAPPSASPKFKVTPSKTTSPAGQTQKIVISKGDAEIQKCHNIETGNENVTLDTNESEERIEMITRNKFKRYGLLANAKNARKRIVESAVTSNNSEGSNLSLENSCKTRPRRPKLTKSFSPQESQQLFAQSLEVTNRSSIKNKKQNEIKKQTMNTVCPPLYQPIPANQVPFSADKFNYPNPLRRRPSPPEIQFRPSNPSSYGCQTSSSTLRGMSGSSSSYQLNMNKSRSVYENLVIVDTASSETYISTPKCKDSPIIIKNNDCPIEIVSVESLNYRDYEGYVVPSTSNQVSKSRQITIDYPMNHEITSPISLESSSSETIPLIVIEDDEVEDCLPPFLQRTSPLPTSCMSRSPPSLKLQRIPSPPPLVYAGHVSKSSLSDCQEIPHHSPGSQNSIYTEGDTPSNNTGTSQIDYRKLKKERFFRRQKAMREIARIKKAYLKEKQLFTRKKCQEKALQVKYLSMKVKNKELKMALLEKQLKAVGR